MTTEAPVNVLLGKRNESKAVRVIDGTDAFGDAPFYAAGEDSKSEHINPIPEGSMICGTFRGLRESKTANSSGSKSWYACLEIGEGEDMQRVRVMAPTMLRNVLTEEGGEKGVNLVGQYIELTYAGEKEPISGGRPYHVFTIGLEKTNH